MPAGDGDIPLSPYLVLVFKGLQHDGQEKRQQDELACRGKVMGLVMGCCARTSGLGLLRPSRWCA